MVTQRTGRAAAIGRSEVRSFSGWLVALGAAHIVQGAMAEVVQSPVGMALRYRSVSGQVSKRVIEGRDPTEVRAGRSRFEILYSRLMGPVPLYEDKPDGGYRLDVFLRSDGPMRANDCLRATQNLAKDFDIPLVDAVFRRDVFFALSDGYPLLNPLVEFSRLPTEQIPRPRANDMLQGVRGILVRSPPGPPGPSSGSDGTATARLTCISATN